MYRRPKFLEVLLEIRQEMAREADYDVDLFTEMIRAGSFSDDKTTYKLTEDSDSETNRPKNRKPKTANRK